MAIDMTTVKQIMHNNKEVVKIEDGLGKVLWQKVADQPYRRLEYLTFDGTCFCKSVEHNAANRAYRLDYIQTGWNDNGLCYPFGIWTPEDPHNILLTRNERSNTNTGFEICRVGNTSFGTYPPDTYINKRIVAEMRWGTDTTVYYRLREQSASNYIADGSGAALDWTSANRGNFFIGAINDGGGGSNTNANGLLVGRIYEVAIAGSNSFQDYGYAYVPCQRKSDGAIGFKQPHLTGDDSFHPLLNKSDGSIVTNVTAHMGPVVEENWDGVTYTIQPSPVPTYRRLEYIHFSGSEHIDTGMKPKANFYYLNCKLTNRTDNWYFIWGAAHTVNNNILFRLFWQGVNDGTINPRLKNTNTDSVSDATNKIIQLRLRNYSTNNSSGTYWLACNNLNGDGLSDGTESTQMMGKYYNSSTYACNFNNFNTTIGIGQYHRNNSWTDTGAQAIMNVYRYFIRDTDDNSSITNDQYPCQRKSDGVCGLYDTVTQKFYPMQGTNITSTAAGPVVDENWDLTAPA